MECGGGIFGSAIQLIRIDTELSRPANRVWRADSGTPRPAQSGWHVVQIAEGSAPDSAISWAISNLGMAQGIRFEDLSQQTMPSARKRTRQEEEPWAKRISSVR